MEDAIIYATLISSVFAIIGLLIMDRNWFRRERFKFDMDMDKKEQTLRFKKMARDLGLDSPKSASPPFRSPAAPPPLGNIGALIEIAKTMDPAQLQAVMSAIGGLTSGGEEEGPEGLPGGLDGLLKFAEENPEIVKGFMDRFKMGAALGGGGENAL